jgi:hypothetical protein
MGDDAFRSGDSSEPSAAPVMLLEAHRTFADSSLSSAQLFFSKSGTFRAKD